MIKLLFLDVDGTLTDGKITYGSDGTEYKSFNIKDGYGLKLCQEKGIKPIIITGRSSLIVDKRMKELSVFDVYQGVSNKEELIKSLMIKNNCSKEELAYMGDDLNDISAMKLCGIIGCPKDAYKRIIEIALFVSSKNGGEGAVREFIDFLIQYNE